MNKFKLLILILYIISIQNILSQDKFEIVMLNNKEFKKDLKNGITICFKTNGDILINGYEYKYVDVKKDYSYETSSAGIFCYKDYIFIDLVIQHYEYGAAFQTLINYKKKQIILKRPFIYNPIKEIFGYNDYLIIIGLEKIEIFNLLKERFQYQEYLNNKVDKVTTNKNEINIIFRNKSTKKYTYNELILLNNLNKLLYPVVDSLRFREYPSTEGKFIRNLKKGEKLELLEIDIQETINGVKGNWVKIKTEKGEIGWCFDAYLEEVKQDDVKKN